MASEDLTAQFILVIHIIEYATLPQCKLTITSTGQLLLVIVHGITKEKWLRLHLAIPTAHNWRIHKNLI